MAYLSGASLPRLSWKKRPLNGCRSSSCSREEPLWISGEDFLWAGYPSFHSTITVNAVKITEITDHKWPGWPHPFFTHL